MKSLALGLLLCAMMCVGCGDAPSLERAVLSTTRKPFRSRTPMLPSANIVSILLPLQGTVAKDEEGMLGEERLRFSRLMVADGPRLYASFFSMSTTYDACGYKVPLETDGDVEDLFLRITGKHYPNIRCRMSRAYLEARAAFGEDDERPSLYVNYSSSQLPHDREDLFGPVQRLPNGTTGR